VSQPQELTIEQAISRAKKATKQGNIKVALQLYNTVLQSQPNHPVAKKRLRKLQKTLPPNQSANEYTVNPPQNQIDTLTNLYHTGQVVKVEQACRELLQNYPQSLFVFNVLGASLLMQGKSQAAVQVFDKAIEIEPGFAGIYNDRGVALKELGKLKNAIQSYDRAIELKPDYAEAHGNRGDALKGLGKFEEAVESYERATKLKPDYVDAYVNCGSALRSLGQLGEAIKRYDNVIKVRPGYAEAYNNRGNALRDIGQLEGAVKNYDIAIKLKPDYAEAYNNRGKALSDLGQLKEAVENYEKVVELMPDFAEAYLNLSVLKKFKPDNTRIGLMKSLLLKSELSKSDRMYLCFALAKVHDDLDEYDRSFNYLVEGNHLRKNELNYNIDYDRRIVAKIKEIFTTESQTLEVSLDENAPMQPIFIVGMLRSGTSLVEQILASHSQVYGAGELGAIDELVSPIIEEFSDRIGQYMDILSQSKITSVHDGYLGVLAALNVQEKIIIDKMPINFKWIGFILSAFPKAKIINLNRDPRATCWSIYKHYFPGNGNRYAYDFGDLAEFYKLYIDLMSFWRERYPNSIYDVCYEGLTENQEEETRRLLAFCDLEWEKQCLDFHNTKRAVKTASVVQVRKKMYQGSSDAWRKYEEYMQPLIKGLGY